MTAEKKLIILCGPSGSGKTTIAHHLLNHIPGLTFSVSATTRAKRGNEQDGKDYHFLSVHDFKTKISEDAFVEYEEVYHGLFYGTLKSELNHIWDQGKIPVLDIDVVGALNIKNNYAPQALTVFIHPISVENLTHRLKKRATESEESFAKRIHKAEDELNMARNFQHVIYNEKLETAQSEAETYITEYLNS